MPLTLPRVFDPIAEANARLAAIEQSYDALKARLPADVGARLDELELRCTRLARENAALTMKVSALETEALRAVEGPTETDGDRTTEEPISLGSSDFMSFSEIDDSAFASVQGATVVLTPGGGGAD